MNSRTRGGEEFSDKLNKNDNHGGSSSNNKVDSTSSGGGWMRSKDPRIVRVSRAFGGKDRHSKVCTIRGLRDRRVRLSVPTAIQIYDLQDRLGLNQPSKVVDWLLNVAKDDIDELPPLQIPPGFNFLEQAHQAMLSSSSSHAANQPVGAPSQTDHQERRSRMNASWDEDAPIDLQKSSFWTNFQPRSTKLKHLGTKEVVMNEKEMWGKGMSDDRVDDQKLETLELGHGIGGGGGIMQVGSSSNFFPRTNNNSLLNFLQSVSPYGSYYHSDYPSNFSLSSSSSHSKDHHHHHHHNIAPLQSASLSLPSGPHVLVCPPAMEPSQSYFPSHVAPTAVAPMELDPKDSFTNHFQILSPARHHMSLDDTNKKR